MNKLLFSILIIFLVYAKAEAQKSSLIFFSDENNSNFRVFLNGQKQNHFFQRKIEIKELSAKKYKIRIVFEKDSIADIDEVIKIDDASEKTIAIIAKSNFDRKVDKIGRKINHSLFKNGNPSGEIKLVDYFALKVISETKIEKKDIK